MTTLLAVLMTGLASPAVAERPELSLPDPSAMPTAPGFDLSEPLAYDDPKPEDLGKWKGAVSLGATVSNGNTNRKTATATANAELRREKDRFTFGLLWNLSLIHI